MRETKIRWRRTSYFDLHQARVVVTLASLIFSASFRDMFFVHR